MCSAGMVSLSLSLSLRKCLNSIVIDSLRTLTCYNHHNHYAMKLNEPVCSWRSIGHLCSALLGFQSAQKRPEISSWTYPVVSAGEIVDKSEVSRNAPRSVPIAPALS